MKKLRIIYSLIIVVITFFNISCNKDDIDNLNDFSDLKNDAPLDFYIGNQLRNPYSIDNMTIARDSLLRIGMLSTYIDIAPTHLYIKMSPSDSAEMNLVLEDTNLNLFPYPLDYEIGGEGSFEITEGTTPVLYTVVPVSYKVPIPYSLLEECFIPNDDNDKELAILEMGAYALTGNLTEEEKAEGNMKSTKASKEYPKGYVKVFNTEENGYEGVKGVKVYARRFVKIGKAYTDANGRYSIGKGYRHNVHYSVSFENKDGFKIWGNLGPLAPAIHNVGKHSRFGYDILIGQNSKAWPWATINNAAIIYRTKICPHFNVSNTPNNLRFAYLDISIGNYTGAAPMFRHIAGVTATTVANFLYSYNTIPSQIAAVVVGGMLYCCLKILPDIVLYKGSTTSTQDMQRTVFHEMSHASHYSNVGPTYWLNYVTQICVNFGYGSSYNGTNNIIGVGEMWGSYFATKCSNYINETNNNVPNSNWYKPKILQEVDDAISTIGPSEINRVMDPSVTSHILFRQALIDEYGHSSTITRIFEYYGF